jgi:hypothetical protein
MRTEQVLSHEATGRPEVIAGPVSRAEWSTEPHMTFLRLNANYIDLKNVDKMEGRNAKGARS